MEKRIQTHMEIRKEMMIGLFTTINNGEEFVDIWSLVLQEVLLDRNDWMGIIGLPNLEVSC